MFKKLPNLYYGWWITITLAITETVSWGIIFYAFSVFITTTETELGWTRAQITGAFSLSLLMTALGSYPVGWILDRYGSRLLMTIGSIIATCPISPFWKGPESPAHPDQPFSIFS